MFWKMVKFILLLPFAILAAYLILIVGLSFIVYLISFFS
jgi:hypothetical protein